MSPDPRKDPNGFALAWPVPRGMLMAADRLNYWRKAGEAAAGLKDDELRRGLDRHGREMTRISNYTRLHRRSAMGVAEPAGPPLTPAYGLSRTRSLLRWKPYLDRVVFYWDFDINIGDSWGVILGYHRSGADGRLPKRDVIGLSARARNQARREADKWWAAGGHDPVAPPVPRGFQQVYLPRPIVVPPSPRPKPVPVPRPTAVLTASPIRPFKTGPMEFKNGRFVPVKVKHGITPLSEKVL